MPRTKTSLEHHSEVWDQTIGRCFREQAALRPDSPAVVDGEVRLSYAQLEEQATVVARHLIELGVEPETLVGTVYPRSAEAIVVMLGIVLAHGAYVPLNPGYPDGRLRQIVGEGRLGLVLCPAGLRDRMVEVLPDQVRVRSTGELIGAVAGTATALPEAPSTPGSPLAYVMFTSGSTGRPKGVMVEHRGVLRLVRDTDYLDLSGGTRMLHGAALEFDASTLEIWGALLNGGTLYVADQETLLVPERYAAALRTNAITTAWLTAPLFHQLVEVDPTMFAPLHTLLTGGDVVSPDHARRVVTGNPGLRLLNGYGPTENTTFTSVFPVEGGDDRPLPIGRPIRGTTVLILDERLEPVPDGTIGELCTGGAGLARGYLDRPELTRERFVMVGGQRYYRTGDQASQDPDGLLHFHGRTDDQVKIAGNLVVLSDVTATLLAVPGVREATVRVWRSPDERQHLVAYLVAPAVPDEAVGAAVAAALPAYMHPDTVVRMPRLPLAASGKVDWRALPVPVPAPRSASAGTLSPEQSTLARLWAEVLLSAADAIGPADDFFDLGGDSIRLGRLVGLISRSLDRQPSLSDLHRARTLAAMADVIRAGPVDAFRPIPDSPAGPVRLHPNQAALYALWQSTPDSLAYNVPARLDLTGALDVDRLRAALRAVVRRHDALRMRFRSDGVTVFQEPVDGPDPEFEFFDEGGPGPAVRSFVRPFVADRPPHLRARLVRIGPDRHTLYLDTHHAVVDGVSLGIMVDELFAEYGGSTSPAPPLSYAAAAQWCHDRLGSEQGAADEAYWLAQLADPPASSLPTEHPRGPHRSVSGAVLSRPLDPLLLESLRAVATRHRSTLYSVLLAGYVAVLARMSGQADLVVGSPLNGRIHPDLQAVVGMFVGTVCLRCRLEAGTTLGDLVDQLEVRSREAQEHQGQPFDRITQQLGLDRDPSRNPLFDAFFALQNIDLYEFGSAGLAASLELINPGTTRFDLNLQAYLRPDRLVLELEYASELFDPESAGYFLDQYVSALADIAADPRQPVRLRLTGAAAVPCPDFTI
jgi:amino acid adenylation domain-containing protein